MLHLDLHKIEQLISVAENSNSSKLKISPHLCITILQMIKRESGNSQLIVSIQAWGSHEPFLSNLKLHNLLVQKISLSEWPQKIPIKHQFCLGKLPLEKLRRLTNNNSLVSPFTYIEQKDPTGCLTCLTIFNINIQVTVIRKTRKILNTDFNSGSVAVSWRGSD